MARFPFLSLLALSTTAASIATPRGNTGPPSTPQCRQTKVAILGGGLAGVTAAQTLHNASISDFLILEYNNALGGRMVHTTFGNDSSGNPYVVELGANWVQGLGTPGGPENPIWRLAKKWGIANTYSDYANISSFNAGGAADFVGKIAQFYDAYDVTEKDAGTMWALNQQDRSERAGLTAAGWRPAKDMEAQAAEWWGWDWEYAFTPGESSQEFGVINYNTTFYQYSDENNLVIDHRGFNHLIKGEASTFLTPDDPRLLLNTVVSGVNYTDSGVIITNSDGSCISADYAICTFSLGVLQAGLVSFSPSFPEWKTDGIASMQMGTYTKIFLQFPADKVFWDTATQFFLYADPFERGYYPVWQSLDHADFLPGSGILFATVVQDQSFRAEKQTDEQTKAQVMAVLRSMYPGIEVPEPVAFMYPRWSEVPWAMGSYSNMPPGTSLLMHQNLRANLGRLWFAGEATSAAYFGFLQGAYFEGQTVGATIAACVKGDSRRCKDSPHYADLRGENEPRYMTGENGWTVTSFQTNGL